VDRAEPNIYAESPYGLYDLSVCHSLLALTLTNIYLYPGDPMLPKIQWPIFLIEQLSSSHLKLVQLSVLLEDPTPDRLDRIEWDRLERALSATRRPRLKNVVVRLLAPGGCRFGGPGLITAMRERLPALQSRGLLEIVI
jgi:hypothetical protein